MSAAFARRAGHRARGGDDLPPLLDDHGAATVAALRAGTARRRGPGWWPPSTRRLATRPRSRVGGPRADAGALGAGRAARRGAADDRRPRGAGDGGRAGDPAPRAGRVRASDGVRRRRGAGPRAVRCAARAGGVAGTDDDDAAPPAPAAALPGWPAVRAALADHAGVDPAAVRVCDDGRAAATVLTTAGAVCVFPPVGDLASLTVAAHELGHGVYAAALAGLPLGLAAAPSRAVDEAIAAWAVRALEELLPPAWAVVARWRRRRGERARARLARCEHAALVLGHADAWARAVGPWRPALAAAVLAEPGIAAAYAAADAWALAPARGEIAAWGQRGAAWAPAGLA
jgi:hypothetical protein